MACSNSSSELIHAVTHKITQVPQEHCVLVNFLLAGTPYLIQLKAEAHFGSVFQRSQFVVGSNNVIERAGVEEKCSCHSRRLRTKGGNGEGKASLKVILPVTPL